MLTKPAAVFVQLLGGLLLLIGVITFFAKNPAGLIFVAIGGAMVWRGGRATRERIRKELHK